MAVVRNGCEIVSMNVYSQIEEHSLFRGVVPEIASRSHLLKIQSVYQQVMNESSVLPEEMDYVAVTNRPGLVGSLMIGGQFAKIFSLVFNTPVVCVDHVKAHMFASVLEGHKMTFPFLGLMLSGGNSSIYRMDNFETMSKISDTMDDALGEAFDKAASILSLPYPGGPFIEKKAKECSLANGGSLFPKLLRDRPYDDITFSFSGIKTAVLRAHEKNEDSARICRDFQMTVFELVERNLLKAVALTGITDIIASGGVLANQTLRNSLDILAEKEGLRLIYPKKKILCTDNGGMIASLGYELYMRKEFSSFNFPVSSRR
jgi:N6-L-threonylcarbamoyladenine synthase